MMICGTVTMTTRGVDISTSNGCNRSGSDQLATAVDIVIRSGNDVMLITVLRYRFNLQQHAGLWRFCCRSSKQVYECKH
eukprot:9570-Heterococcus_DN1.PRE.1